jgi:hypothetical protein
MSDDTCYYCDSPAEYLCDFVLRWRAIPKVPITNEMTTDEFLKAMMSAEPEIETCDRPLCERHRTQKGHYHICDRTKRRLGCQVVTMDYCPGHSVGPGHKPPYQPVTGGRAA